jgi:hypothetical protein
MADDFGGATPPGVQDRIDIEQGNFTGKSYSYPMDGGDIYMNLSFRKYSYSDAKSKAIGGKDSIKLPLPEQLADASNITVDRGELGSVGSFAASAFGNQDATEGFFGKIRDLGVSVGSGTREQFDQLLNGEFKEVGVDVAAATKYFARSGVESLFSGAGLALDVIGGNAINPHATLNFDGVALKEYQFSWTLAPKNEKESDLIRNIIRQINFHIHPKYQSITGSTITGTGAKSLNQALLQYPSLVTASLSGLAQEYYFDFRYPMMVSSFQANYSPQGNSILEGGKPALIQLSMSLKETTIRTRDDYR